MERVMQHYRRQLLLQAMARWKVHHLSCIRKRVRQMATLRVPLCSGAVWARRPHREEERSFQKHLLLLLWMLGGWSPAGARLPFWVFSEGWGSRPSGWKMAQQRTWFSVKHACQSWVTY